MIKYICIFIKYLKIVNMKNKYILMFFILVGLFTKDCSALQIKNIHIGNVASDRWIEVYNDGEDISDLTSYKIIDSGGDSKHTIIDMSGTKSFLKGSTAYIYKTLSPSSKISETLPADASLLFRSAVVLDSDNGFVSIINSDNTIVFSCFSYGSATCSNNSNPTNTSSSTASSTNSTSTVTENNMTNTVYIYVPSNNQNKYGDIQVLLPEEKIVPAGADSEYLVRVLDSQKNILTGLDFNWSFGDGGEKFDSKVNYHYIYPGEYILIASADGYMGGAQAKMKVTVVSPDVIILKVGTSSKENFIDLENRTEYDLFLSNFYLSVDNIFYKLPKNFVIEKKKSVHISGEALGFKLPAFYISLNYPNKDLLTDYSVKQDISTSTIFDSSSTTLNKGAEISQNFNSGSSVDSKNEINKISEGNKSETFKANTQKRFSIIKEPYILKPLILESASVSEFNSTQNTKEITENLNNVKKDKAVDINLIKWLKSLIY